MRKFKNWLEKFHPSGLVDKQYADELVGIINPLGKNIAQVIYVDTVGNDGNGGTSFDDAKLTVQSAIDLIPSKLKGKTYIIAMHPGTYEHTNGNYIDMKNKFNGEIRFQTFAQTLNSGVSEESEFFRKGVVDPIRDDSCLVVLRGIDERVFSLRDEGVWGSNSEITISFVGVNYEAVGGQSTFHYFLDHPFTFNATGTHNLFNIVHSSKLFIATSGVTFDATGNTHQTGGWADVGSSETVILALNIIGDLGCGGTSGTSWNTSVFYMNNKFMYMKNFSHYEFAYYKATDRNDSYLFDLSGVRQFMKGNTIGENVHLDFSPLAGDIGVGIRYQQGVLPDAVVPVIDMSGAGFFAYTKSDFMSVPTSNESDGVLITDTEIVRFLPLPTSDPTIANALWNDSGTVKVSAG